VNHSLPSTRTISRMCSNAVSFVSFTTLDDGAGHSVESFSSRLGRFLMDAESAVRDAPTVEAAATAHGRPEPIGRERFLQLRRRWLTPVGTPRPVPPDQLDEDSIIDAVASCPGDVLDPPVHLPYMAEALAIMWEEEGLYN
jgi:hypothetical protein